jgi:nucleotide-binding universal stress UspA family protein
VTVVLAHVPNESADAAFDAALEQARFRGTGVVVVNVAPGDAPVDDRIVPEDGVAALTRRGADAGVEVTVEQPVDGDVAGAVLDSAKRHDAALVVVGVRRRSAVGKLLMGSVAQRIILDADCQVLGVKGT